MVDGSSLAAMETGMGAIMGYISGYAIKKIFQAIMIIVGVFVMGLFSLASTGVIEINWNRLFATTTMGVSRVADYLISTQSVIMQHMPITAGYSIGLIYALKRS